MSGLSSSPFSAVLLSTIALVAGACAPPAEHEPDGPEPLGEAISAVTVAEAASGSCSTGSVKGLSLQIIDQAACALPGSYVEVPDLANVGFGSAVLPYIQQPARDALVAALQENPGTSMQVNSMLRTVAQQFLLYQWYLNGQCGIALAAKPGNSNHETGLALDINEYNTWKSALTAHGFKWYGSADPVHYDYVGPGAVNYKGADVLAFQMLWNKNHPDDLIAEDGDYGPQTESRLKQSPADGFPIGPDCAEKPPRPDLHPSFTFLDAADDFPDGASAARTDLLEGRDYTAQLALTNKGGAPADNVEISFELPADYLTATAYFIETDFGHTGTFEENDANTDPANPPHDKPLAGAFSLKLNAFSKGETKRVTLVLHAEKYSIDPGESPDLHFWVKDIAGAYHQDAYGASPDNIDASQTFNDGLLELPLAADIYSPTQWKWDTDRREGWESTGDAAVLADPDSGALHISFPKGGAPGDTPVLAESPPLDVDSEALGGLAILASVPGGTAHLYFATDSAPSFDLSRSFELDLPEDGTSALVTIDAAAHPAWTGHITRLGLSHPADSEGDVLQVESLRFLTSAGSGSGGEGGAGSSQSQVSCTCDLPGSPPGGSGRWAVLLLAGMASLTAARRGGGRTVRRGSGARPLRAPRRRE
ncbi:MAG: M15 family metallopeptidase [Polyangiaceae bacterium]